MFTQSSFDEWYAQIKTEYVKAGLTLPEDMEMMELVHMECLEEGKSIETFMQEMIAEQKGSN